MKTGASTGKYSDVPIRIKSWVYIIAVFAVMLLHPLSMSVIVTLLSLYALKEYFTMNPVQSSVMSFLVYIVAVPVFLSLYTNNYCLFVLSVIAHILLLLLVNSFFIREKHLNMKLVTGIIFCVFSIGHLSFIRNLDDPQHQIDGIRVIFFLVLLTELNDIFQYLTGKTLGRRKITPRISPNKTVEGFLGGIVLTTLMANATGLFLLPLKSFMVYTIIGIVIAVLGFCGDVAMSLIKRKAGVKDTGNLIPGHGGLLDRLDSLLFVLPISYWACLIFFG